MEYPTSAAIADAAGRAVLTRLSRMLCERRLAAGMDRKVAPQSRQKERGVPYRLGPLKQKVLYLPTFLASVTLPHSRVAGSEFTRINGDIKLSLLAPEDPGLPYGVCPRLALIHLTTRAILERERAFYVGESANDFLWLMGIGDSGGKNGASTRARDQLRRLCVAPLAVPDLGKVLRRVGSSLGLVHAASIARCVPDASNSGALRHHRSARRRTFCVSEPAAPEERGRAHHHGRRRGTRAVSPSITAFRLASRRFCLPSNVDRPENAASSGTGLLVPRPVGRLEVRMARWRAVRARVLVADDGGRGFPELVRVRHVRDIAAVPAAEASSRCSTIRAGSLRSGRQEPRILRIHAFRIRVRGYPRSLPPRQHAASGLGRPRVSAPIAIFTVHRVSGVGAGFAGMRMRRLSKRPIAGNASRPSGSGTISSVPRLRRV